MHLGILIKEYRDEYGLSMDDFADKSGLSKAYISMLEKNENSRSKKPIIPSLETIKAVSDAIGLDFNRIIEIIDPDTEVKLTPTTAKINRHLRNTIEKLNQLNEESQEDVSKYVDFIYSDKNNRIPTSKVLELSEEYIPIYTRYQAAAGQGACNEYYCTDTNYNLIKSENVPKHDEAITVKGESMHPTISNGDVAFVRFSQDNVDARIYAVQIEDETVIKRCYFEKNKLTLESDNPDWQDRIIEGHKLEQVKIIGLVVGWSTPE